MFHVFGDVYLDIDAALTTIRYSNLAISSRWSKIDLLDPGLRFVQVHASFDDFAKQFLGGDKTKIWSYLNGTKLGDTRNVLYVEPNLYQALQIQYWKSILKNPTVDSVYELHKMFTQDRWFKSFLYDEDSNEQGRVAARELTIMSRETFDKLYQETPVALFLQKLPKHLVSFEYQLADYLRDPVKSPMRQVVLEKVERFTWANWVQELEVLKADLINGIGDINTVLPPDAQINLSDLDHLLFTSFGSNEYLRWMVDSKVSYQNPKYVEATYDRKIFKQLYARVLEAWGAPYEDMSELIDLIYDHKYEQLLERDVARGLGCVYGAGRYRLRMCQVFLTWAYRMKREGTTSVLGTYELA